MNKHIRCVIFDWAGTTVDYGCFAPVAAFATCFKQTGCPVTTDEIRSHMGKTKIEEVRALFAIDHVRRDFAALHGHEPAEADIEACYDLFRQSLIASLADYAEPLPGLCDTIGQLRADGLRIGSTTGYTAEMMQVVLPAAERLGYRPDHCATADGLPGGRPRPYMIYRNLMALDIADRREAMKVGDTIADIREGCNAGVWSVGVVMGSNEMALTLDEAQSMPHDQLTRRMQAVRQRMYAAGADYVIDDITCLPALIDCVNQRMNRHD